LLWGNIADIRHKDVVGRPKGGEAVTPADKGGSVQ